MTAELNLTQTNETLQQLVKRILKEQNLSTYDVARRGQNLIHQTTVNRIANGKTVNPRPDQLKGLAFGLGLPLQVITDAFYNSNPSNERIINERFKNMAEIYDTFSDEKKIYALPILEMVENELKRIARK